MSIHIERKKIVPLKSKISENAIYTSLLNEINNLEDWGQENVEFNLPISNFDQKQLEEISKQINTFINKNSEDELHNLSLDEKGNRKKLSDEQLNQIRKTGKFSVNSQMFEGKKHVWEISNFLQRGSQSILKDRQNGLAKGVEKIICDSKNYLVSDSNFNTKNGLINIGYSIHQFFDKLLGLQKKEIKFDEYEIHDKLEKMRYIKLIEELHIDQKLIEDLNNNKCTKIITDSVVIDLILNNNNEEINNLKDKYKTLNKTWENTAAARKEKYRMDYNNNQKIYGSEFTSININEYIYIYNKELEERNSNLLNLINETISEEHREIIINFIKSKELIRNIMENKCTKYNNDLKLFKIKLENEHPILNNINSWKENKCIQFKNEWEIKHSLSESYNEISLKLTGQFKYLFDSYLNYYDSKEIKNKKKELERKKISSNFFEWDFVQYNKIGKSYKTITTKTNHLGWRFTNIFMRTIKNLHNGVKYMVKNSIFGNFGLCSLFGTEDKEYYGETITTWIGRVKSIIDNISESREYFKNQPDNGFLGKKVSNIGNIIWNYGFKGLIGIPVVFIFHPLTTVLKLILSTGVIFTSILWSPLYALAIYVINSLIYDIDSSPNDIWFLPLANIIINRLLIKGIGQVILSLGASITTAMIGTLRCLFTEINTMLKTIYDKILYNIIIKNFARVPAQDNFSAKRIEGPELSKNYYYQLTPEIAMILLSVYLENMEITEYKKYVTKVINEPIKVMEKMYKTYSPLGFSLDTRSETYKSLENTKKELIQKFDLVMKEHSHKKNIDNLFKMTGTKLKMTSEDINKIIQMGETYCKKYIEKNIFKYMKEKEIKLFWNDNLICENDWTGLTKELLKKTIDNNILIPIDNLDGNGFKLKIEHSSIRSLFGDLFSQIVEPLERYNIVNPNFKPKTISQKFIDPSNFDQEKYTCEKFIELNNLNIFNKIMKEKEI